MFEHNGLYNLRLQILLSNRLAKKDWSQVPNITFIHTLCRLEAGHLWQLPVFARPEQHTPIVY